MIISDKKAAAVRECLATGRPFALYRLPGRVAQIADARHIVRIVPWGKAWAEGVDISNEQAKSASPSLPAIPSATPRDIYLYNVESLVTELCRRRCAKTVLSRIIAGSNPTLDLVDAAEKLWQTLPDTLGYLFHSPATGTWLGASPEKLLLTYPPCHFATQALAGTLPIDTPWNVKNYEEQQIVADFISTRLDDIHLQYNAIGPRDLKYGSIKHLSTAFTGDFTHPDTQRVALLDSLSPTPALCGFPRETAYEDIAHYEDHQRGCYGGYITVTDGDRSYSFVTIRCAMIDHTSGKWAVYVGSGITRKSAPQSEWLETQAKAAYIVDILSK